ncbi:cadherin-like domain-containing protein [Ramlibacter sp. AN1133]|uniref:cadherin-like domain-containing protein n=1 Tax=Ramlibacter sp. AN1133 TaxID=3133429 RepID=UPI0030BE1BDF
MLKRWLRRNKPPRAQRIAPHAEWLEQRLLYSADAGSLLGVDTALAPAPEERTLDASFEYDAAAGTAAIDVRSALALTPLQFEADAGQLGEGVDFAASGLGYAVRLGGGNAELLLEGAQQPVTLTLVGAQPGAPEGQDLLATRSNYLVGTDSSKWITDIVNYGSVLYRGVYDGIDVRYYGNQQQLEYDFVVAAGADASQLQLRFDGIESASLDGNGDLVLRVAGTGRDIRFQAPVSYQEGAGGREAVDSRYELQQDGTVRIVVGAYDRSRALVVDPVLAHASYFGENGNETARGVAVGSDGSVYVTGHTTSTTGSFGTRMALGADATESYVAKFNADLTTLVYATRVGGSAADAGAAIAVDAAGNAVVTGWTRSTDFVVTTGADQAARNGNQQDAFVYKLNSAGNGLLFGTYFGGAGNNDAGEGVTLDAAGNIYVAGMVSDATDNAFLNKYTATGSAVYKIQYGGSGIDGATGVALDAAGNVYIAGSTLSVDNVTLNGAQVTRPGNDDAFLAKYNSAGTLTYATYIGAAKADVATGLAVDNSGRAYVVGRTKDASASGFAITAGAFATTAYTHETGFLRVYNTTLTGSTSLEYSTFIGGSRNGGGSTSSLLTDSPTGVAVSGGQVVVVGHTDTADFPTTADAYSRTNTGGDTGFVIVLAPQGGGSRDQIYGSYYGTGLQTGGVAWSGSRFYLVGSTGNSGGNLATADGYKTTFGSGTEGVVAQFSGFTNVAPMLAGATNLAQQLEDVPAAGTLVSDLLAGRFSDGDAGALAGIAVTGFDAGNGSWQFSLDGGASWSTMAAPAAGSALVLNADALTRVRFAPAADFVGGSSITFRGWDRSAGAAGTVVTMPTTGGSSAFSIVQATATVSVAAVNDAPVRTGTLGTLAAGERTAAIPIAPAFSGVSYAAGAASATDESGQSLRYVVTGLPDTVGTILFNGSPVAVGSSFTWAELQTLGFLPGRFGTGTFTFSAVDDGGTANGGQDTLADQAITFSVTNVAPVLNVSTVTLPGQLEDLPGTGTRVADFMAGKVTDGGGAWGIAVVSVPGAGSNGGAWQYSVDDGASWQALTGSFFGARLLGPDARVRFLSDADWSGTPTGFTFRAWDGSSGVSGGTAFALSGGGTSAFSSSTAVATAAITAVNDGPDRVDGNVYANNGGGKLAAPAPVTVSDSTTTANSLNLGYLKYVGGFTSDEYTRPWTITITELPSFGTITLGGGTTAQVNTQITLSQLQGATFRPTAQSGSGDFRWVVRDADGTANGGVDTFQDGVHITVANSAPTLQGGTTALPAMAEDAQTSVSVLSLVNGFMSDASGTLGVAVTATSAPAGGSWQWTRDNGATWNTIAGASDSSSVLLQTGTGWRIRYLPPANWNSSLGGTPGISLRGWDRSAGVAGETADTSVRGGTTAFSTGLRTATIAVTAVNDPPVRTDVADPAAPVVSLLDGTSISLGLAGLAFGPGGGADEAGQTIASPFRITALPDSLGATFLANGTRVVVGNSYTLAQIQGMTFTSLGVGVLGKAPVSFTVKDSGGTLNGGVDTMTFSVYVNVNHAPVLTGANSQLVVEEDFGGDGKAPSGNMPPWATPAQRAGIKVSDILGTYVTDTSAALQGIAIIDKAGAGTWQYTLDGGSNWINVPAVSNTSTLLLAANANTRVRFIPEADWNSNIGATSITFRAWDQTVGTAGQLGDATYNGGASAYSAATATSTVTVTPRNDAPVAASVVGGMVAEGDPATAIFVSATLAPGPATATDEAAQALTVTFPSGLPTGIDLFLADGVTPVNAAASYTLAQFRAMTFRGVTPGSFQLAFQLQDNGGVANGGVDRATFSVGLTVTNKAPLLAGANPLAGIQEDSADNGTLVTDLVAWQVSDPTRTRGIAVTGVDNSHGTWQYTRDGGTTWTAFGTPTAGTARLLLADTTTRVRFVPAADWNGTATLTFAAWDGTAGTAGGTADTTAGGGTSAFSSGTATSSITVSPVNDAPVGGTVASLAVAEDSGSTSLGLGAVSYGPGGGGYEDSQALAYTITVLPDASLGRITLADGTDVALGATTLDALRGMRFVTAANAAGSGSFTFLVQDDGGGTDTLVQTVAITVMPVDDAPVAGFDLFTATEDTPLTIAPATLLANDTDADGDALTVTAVNSGFGGTVALVNGDIVFTPAADFNGMASFSYTISDGHGGTSITGVVLNVAAVNDAPRPAADTVAATEDQPLTIAPATLLGNDTDVEGDALTVTGVAGASGGTVSLSGGSIVFTPTADFNGAGSFTYTVSDAQGATATATVTVNIAAVNDAPVGTTETLATNEDTPLSITPATLLANDSDIDGDTLSVIGVASGTGGSVTLSGGNIVFTPGADFNGAGSFSYTVSDGHGGAATVAVTVNVAPVNDAPVTRNDTASTVLGLPVTIPASTLLANDTDAEGDTLTITAVGGAVNGTVSLSGSNIQFTPTPLYSGPASFTYTVSDGNGGVSTATVDVSVLLGNRAPTAADDTLAATEDVPRTIGTAVLLANDSDPDLLDTISITGVSAVAGGAVSLAGNTITFTPSADFNGPARFTYTLRDSQGATATGTVTVNVAAQNDAPRLSDDTVAGTEDQPVTIVPAALLGNDTDVDGDAMAITGVTAVAGGSVSLANGNIVFTPDANFNGAGSFRYTVTDAQGAAATATVTVNVAAVNDAPVATTETLATDEDTPLTVTAASLLANDTDVENDPLTIVGVASGTGGTVTRAGSDIVFTPNANFNGTGSFSYTISDGQGGTSTVAVTVNVAALNDRPVANAETLSGTEDQALTIAPATLLANDTDVDGNTLTVTAVNAGTGGSVALSGGNIVFTPAANFNGAASFSYTISDGNGGTATATVTLNLAPVNDAPAGAADAVAAVEDVPLTIAAGTLLANDTDVDGDVLAVTGVSSATGGTVSLSGGNIVFTPTADFHGTGGFTYTLSDGHGGNATASVTVNVASVNDDPVARGDAAQTAEDTPLTLAPATLLANDSDSDGDALAVVAVGNGVGGTVGLVNGNVVFTPTADFNGSGSFSYTVSDGHGGTATGTVAVVVTAVNDAPVASTDTLAGSEDALVVFTADTLLANDADTEGDTLTIVGVADGTGGTVTISGTSIVFTPDDDFNGTGSFTYTVSDGRGGTSSGNVVVEIAAVNDPPLAQGDVVAATEDQALTIAPATLLADDTDVEGDALSVSDVGNASGGTVTLSGGNIVFTPDPDFNGVGSFTYTVRDAQGATGTATVTVNVAAVNDAPVAQGELLATLEDTPLVLDPGGLLANDSDVDGDALSVVGVVGGSGGVVELSGGSVIFTPDADFNGTGSFGYVVSDGKGGTATVSVTVDIAAVNDAPVAGADSVGGVEDTPVTIATATLLANDSDVEGDALTVSAVGGATGGTVQLSGGTIVFTPSANFNGAAGFSYTVSDGHGGTATGAVVVNLAAVEDDPVAGDDTVAGVEDTPLTIASVTLIGNDSDADGDILAITSVAAGTGGSVVLSGSDIVFTPDADFNGAGSFSYTVDDGHGGTSTATVTVNVAPVNDPPVAGNDAVAGTEDQPLTIAPATLLVNDSDIDGDTVAITGVTSGAGGTVALVGGNIVFTPTGNFNGSGSFSYTLSDGQGGAASATVTVNVAPVNDAPVGGNDTVAGTEDQPLTIVPATLLANDSDIDVDALAITGVTAGTGGTVAIVGGNIVFTPTANFNGTGSFSYTVSDGQGGTTTAMVTVNVAPINDAPTASDDTVAVTEDQPLTIVPVTLLGNDSDIDGDTLAITGVNSGTGGTVAIVGGNIVFTPTQNFNGTGSFSYTVGDGQGGTTTATVTVNVAPVNDMPAAGNDTVAATEDQALTIAPPTLLANDSDIDGDTLAITGVTAGTGGTVAIVGGNIVFTPTQNFNGTGSFGYTVSDGQGGTTTATVIVNVAPVNDEPLGGNDTVSATEDQPLTIVPATLLANDSDIDADTLAITGVTSGAGGTVALVGGSIVFTPTANFNGTGSFSYTVSDGQGGTTTATVTVSVAPVNDTPAAGNDTVTATEDQPLTIAPATLLANDSDVDGDTLAITGVNSGTGGTVAIVGGNIVFTPTANFNGTGSFSYTVSDGQGGTTTATVTVNVAAVNDSPAASNDTVAATEDRPLTIAPATLLANDSDIDGDTLAITGVNSSTGGTVTIVGGNIVFTPTANFNGTGSFSYTVSDGQGGTTTATVTVNVAPVNDAPAVGNDTVAATEDQPLTIAPATLLANDSDIDADTLAITGVTSGVGGTVAIVGGNIVFTPTANFNGTGSFSYIVSDGQGGTTTATVTVNVAAVNDSPAASNDTVAATEDQPLTIAPATLLGNDSDIDGDTLAITGVTSGIGGTATIIGGSIIFTPTANFNGPGSFSYTLSDGQGGTTTATVTVNVAPVNDTPAVGNDTVAATEDQPLTIVPTTLLANDSDIDGDMLAITGVNSSTGGTVAIVGGNIIFTPTANFNGTGSFSYTVSDGQGGTATATVTVNVAAVNDAPLAGNDTVNATEDQPLTIAPATLLVNDSDIDGDTVAITGVTSGAGGSVALVGGNIVFTPTGNFNGSGSFSYTVSDSQGGTTTATVTVNVAAVNDSPAASNDTVAATEDQPLTIAPATLLANDSDIDGDTLAITGVTSGAGGTVAIVGGNIVFTPAANFSGSGSFSYTASDGQGGTASATVTVNVAPVNDAPAASNDTVSATEDQPLTIVPATLLADDSDIDGDTLAIIGVTSGVGGTVSIVGGNIVFTPTSNFNGTGSFTYTVDDGQGGTTTATVTMNVAPVNDAPAAGNDTVAATEDQALAIAPSTLLANDSDIDGDTLAITGVTSGTGGTVSILGGNIVFTPTANFSGTGRFSYTISDGHGGTATASVTLDIAAVDDPTVTAPDNIAIAEDGVATGNVLANDTDPDSALALAGFRVAGDTTDYAAGASATIAGVGSLRIAGDGSFTFTPLADWNGTVPQVTYLTSTGATGTLAITVAAVDDATVTAPDAAVGSEDTPVSGNVLANDADVDSSLAITSFRIAGTTYAAGATAAVAGVGTLSVAADGSWLYAPVADWAGTVPQVSYTTSTGATGVLAIRVAPVNDAPVRTGTLAPLTVGEGANAPLGFAGVSYGVGGGADEATTQTLTVRVTAVPAELGAIVLADGTRVAAGASYSVEQLQGMVFRAAAGVSGSATFGFTVSDGAGGTDSLAEQLTLRVANVAPVLEGANALPAVAEDTTDSSGMLVADLIAGHASDPGGRMGVAVTGAASTAGQWQYSRDGGAHWSDFTGVSAASAELLPADGQARVRFVPNADWNGIATGLAFRAWDGSGGTAAATRADTAVNGGSSPFSAGTATTSVTVAPVNDAPRALGTEPAVIGTDAATRAVTLDQLAWTYSAGGGSDEAGQALTVTVSAVPPKEFGQLVLADGTTPVTAGSSYTPDQLRGLRFIAATGSNGGTAEVTWVVRDDGGTAGGGVDRTSGSVKIAVVAQAPATPTPTPTPAPAPAPTPTPAPAPAAATAPAPEPAAAPAHAAPAAPAPAAASRPGGEPANADGLIATAPPAVLMPPATEFAFAPQRIVDVTESARLLGAGPRLPTDLQLVGFNPQGAGEFQITGLNAMDVGAARVTAEQFQQSLRSGIFIEELNRLRNELRHEFDLDKTLSVSVAGVSLGVSVVYVLWLIRGGVLLGSYLSALPAWRLLDPLPVLARHDGETEEDDDDEAFDPDETGRADPLRGFS